MCSRLGDQLRVHTAPAVLARSCVRLPDDDADADDVDDNGAVVGDDVGGEYNGLEGSELGTGPVTTTSVSCAAIDEFAAGTKDHSSDHRFKRHASSVPFAAANRPYTASPTRTKLVGTSLAARMAGEAGKMLYSSAEEESRTLFDRVFKRLATLSPTLASSSIVST